MTIDLTYNNDLSRVQVALSALPDAPVQVQRVLNPAATEALWARSIVRGGSALPIAGGIGNLDDFEFFPDIENHYRVVDEGGTVIESDSITPSLAGRVWLKSIRYPGLNRPVTITEFTDPARASRATASEIAGRGAPVGTHELRGSAEFTLELQTTSREAAGDLDIILAAGSTFFVHVPANCAIPGGYVQISDTEQVRRTRSARSDRRYTTLPCRVVAPPAPQVTGTLLTAETVFRLYGDANALFAAHSTGRSLLQTIADPSDVVVL